MFKGVTQWLGVVDNTQEDETVSVNAEGEEKVVPKTEPAKTVNENAEENDDLISPETKQTLEDVSAKAIIAAKEWGNYLYTFGKQATKSVTDTAKEITKSVEEKTFLGDFSKEQDKFVSENKEKEKKSEAAVPPWVGYNEEDSMKSQILALSQDKRNFLRNPPSGIQFNFDFDALFPIAMATLQEDSNLQKMRFDLVPKQVNEEIFWRNYFYRVSLIKQSTQLTSLAQQTEDRKSGASSRDSSTSSENREKSSPTTIRQGKEEAEMTAESPQENEFVSDAFQDGHISDADFKKEMEMLGVQEEESVEPVEKQSQWEQELQKELQEYEMVNEGNDIDDMELENEILQQIEEETAQP